MPLGPVVINREVATFGAAAPALGTAFVVGEANQGPEGPTLVRSLTEFIATFGERTTSSATLYDFADLFFNLQGRRLYVARPLNAAAKVAELTLEDTSTSPKPTILIEWATKGTEGNKYKIEVKAKESKYEVRLLNGENELVEANPPKATQKEIIEWWETHAAYIKVSASKASGASTNPPKEIAATSLAGGANPSALSDEEAVKGLALFATTLGPGYVALPGHYTEAIHKGLAEHASSHNRRAIADLEDSANVTTLISGKTALSSSLDGYIEYTSSTCEIPGLVSGTTRKAAGSAARCALGAQVAATENNNQAAAGPAWPVSPHVTGFTNTFSLEGMESLVENGINPWAERQGVLCLYGFSSAVSQAKDAVYWSAAAGAERMALTFEGAEILESVEFKTIDGQGHLYATLASFLDAMCLRHWERGALFGATPEEAFAVEVGEPINTPAMAQRGEVAAQLEVRISEFVQSSLLVIVSRGLTEAV